MKHLRSALALVALLVASVPIPARAQEPVIARLTTYDGSLDVIRSGIPLSLYVDLPLFTGDTVSTRDGRATVRFEDKTEIRLRKNTKVTISDRKERRDIDVFFGRLWAFVSSQKEKTTSFKTGTTIAAVRGTVLEYGAEPPRVGVVKDGPVDLIVQNPDGTTSTMSVPQGFQAARTDTGVSDLTPFSEGQIADGSTAGAPPPPPPLPPPIEEPAPPPTEAAGTPDAGAAAAAAAMGAAATGPPTQGKYAMQLINALGLQSALPANATVRDATNFLANLGILPTKGNCNTMAGTPCECNGFWRADEPITLEDLLCIVNLDPNDPEAIALSQEEVIEKILSSYGELFWIQTRRKLTVSPFAP